MAIRLTRPRGVIVNQPTEGEDERTQEMIRILQSKAPGWKDALIRMAMESYTEDSMPRLRQAFMSRRERASAQIFFFTRGKIGNQVNSQYQAYLKRQWQKRLTRDNERVIVWYEHGVYALGKLMSRWRKSP